MKIRFTATLLAIFFFMALNAQDGKIKFEKYTLKNGLKVLLHQDNSSPNVVVSVTYHVGSKNEQPNRTGFAHFFEHLLFEGSENIGRGEFDQYITKAGGEKNAYTTEDYTYYYEILPANYLELALWMESERMLHAKVDQKGIAVQKEVVREEKSLRIDNQPYGGIGIEVAKRAFTKHPYRWRPIGKMEHLASSEESDFIKFYQDFYVPNNAILTIAGNFETPKLKGWVEKYFGTIPKKEDPIYRPKVVEPALATEVRDTVYDNIQVPMVVQAYRVPALGAEDYYALNMLVKLMSEGQSSRLYKSLVDERGIALTAGNQTLDLEDPGVIITYGIANVGIDPFEVEEAMDEAYAAVKTDLIPQREFQKLRNQVEKEFVISNVSMEDIAERLATYELFFDDANLINTELERYMKVTREDIRRVAKKYFDKNNRVVLYWLARKS